jgi:GNAT superfamily N-acetyltransferase
VFGFFGHTNRHAWELGAVSEIDFGLAPLVDQERSTGERLSMNHEILEQVRGDYLISSDPARLDLVAIHRYLTAAYWSQGLPMDVLERAVAGSLCFGLYYRTDQIGFARVITDAATFAYLCDVYILEPHRNRGLARWLMEVVTSHASLQGLRRFVLVTRDAHGLYAKFGFRPLAQPDRYMELHRPDVYRKVPMKHSPSGHE